MEDKTPQSNSEFILFKTEDQNISVDVRLEEETVWLTQDQIAVLFGVERPGITQHIKNIFSEGELQENSVSKKFLRTATDGKKYDTKHYNLDMIISLGYRVNSKVATQFRIWATKRLNEYIRKGFTMDDERLKNLGGGGYWKELLQRIRDIRASEKVFYRQVLDIYATSIDYNPKADVSVAFFKKVQNKIHYAVHGQTAAEVIFNRADAEKEFMGLMTFPGNRPYLKDVTIAKNYLNEKAVEKATTEYKKYQQKTLSEAEKNYLESLKMIENKTRNKK
ncbi:MAG: virulence RhuM family protein [Chitinophagaceae bacterium]|nr:virulence RhuM family protein [Chitinophagaceae bacterium]